MRMRALAWAAPWLLCACGARDGASVQTAGEGAHAACTPVGVAATEPAATAKSPSTTSPRGMLTPAKARAYMVELINRDRATAGLSPVTLDEGPATRA